MKSRVRLLADLAEVPADDLDRIQLEPGVHAVWLERSLTVLRGELRLDRVQLRYRLAK